MTSTAITPHIFDNIPLINQISAELTQKELYLTPELTRLHAEIQQFQHIPTDIKQPYIVHMYLISLLDTILHNYMAQSSLKMREDAHTTIYELMSELTFYLHPDSIMKNILLLVLFDSYLKSHTNSLSVLYKCHLIDGILVLSHSSHSKKRIVNNCFSGLVSFKDIRKFVKQEVIHYKEIVNTKLQN